MVKPHSARDEHEGLVVLLHLLGTLADIKHLYYPPSLPLRRWASWSSQWVAGRRSWSGDPDAGAAGSVLEWRGIDKQV